MLTRNPRLEIYDADGKVIGYWYRNSNCYSNYDESNEIVSSLPDTILKSIMESVNSELKKKGMKLQLCIRDIKDMLVTRIIHQPESTTYLTEIFVLHKFVEPQYRDAPNDRTFITLCFRVSSKKRIEQLQVIVCDKHGFLL